MSEIYESPLSYKLVKRYVTFAFKRYYGEFIVVGRENIPTDCPVIFAPNHNNALMDALAVHAVVPSKMPIVFLARSDIFKSKMLASILRFMKIMPAFRMRDGVENLGKNAEIFDQCVDVLVNNKALGIMPEGNQEMELNIRPLVKGIFRVAFAAQQKIGDRQSVKIIPVGMDYGDILKVGKHIIISIGKPIDVADYMPEYIENQVSATNKIKNKLFLNLCNLTLNLATKDHYECFETAVEVANKTFVEKNKWADRTIFRFNARQEIAKKLVKVETENPKKMQLLAQKCAEYKTEITKLKLKSKLLENLKFNWIFQITEALNLMLLFPFFVLGFGLNFFPFFTPVFIRKHIFKAQYEGFFSSLQFGLGIFTFPVFYALQTLIFALFSHSAWWIILIFFVAQYWLGKLALRWNSSFKKYIVKIRISKYYRAGKLKNILKLRKEIISIILE